MRRPSESTAASACNRSKRSCRPGGLRAQALGDLTGIVEEGAMVFSRQFVSNVSKAATGAVRHPLETVEFALGVAKHVVAKGTAGAAIALSQLHSADWKTRHAEAQRDAKQAQADRDEADAAF